MEPTVVVDSRIYDLQEAYNSAQTATDTSRPLSRAEAARNAGLSERQQATAVRVARIPTEEYEEIIESEEPPTVIELAPADTLSN